MKHSSLVIAIVLILSGAVTALAKPAVPIWRDAHPWSTEVASVIVGDIEIQAEIADTSALQTRGLGYREGLEPGTGMVFLFDEEAPRSFWMKGMRFCLDIIWITGGAIVGAAENVCPMPDEADQDLPRYRSVLPVDTVLEVPGNWLIENGVEIGTPVEIILPDQ